MNQSEFKTNVGNRWQARENACERVTIGLVLVLIGWESYANFWLPITECSKANQSKREITFDTQLKIALLKQYAVSVPGIVLQPDPRFRE